MERHEGDTGSRAADEPERVTGGEELDAHVGDDAARPEQTGDDGFGEGYDQSPDTAQENQEPNFARGISDEDAPATKHHGRFSEGQEQLPDSPEKDVQRRFSEGQERSPTSE